MKILSLLLIHLIVFVLGVATLTSDSYAADTNSTNETLQHLLLCAGGDEMFLIDSGAAEQGAVEKIWSWRAETAPGFPADLVRRFNHLDECRPIAAGKRLLVTASNGGCALVERATGKVLWHATATNAHSIELLPNNRVVVASSLSGNHLILFDLAKSDAPLFQTPLHSAHGVIWDESRQLLWAISFDQLQTYRLNDWETEKPALELAAQYKLPTEDGHDLRAVPGSEDLILTTAKSVYLFDRDTKQFRPHPAAADLEHVKAADINPATGRLVIGQWGDQLQLFSPGGKIQFAADKPYKIRWLVEPKQDR